MQTVKIYPNKVRSKTWLFVLISAVLFIIFFFVALMVGRYTIGFKQFFLALFTSDPNYEMERNIIVNLRLPRTIIAGLSGIALSISGLLYQETFKNELVSPDLLGVSNGSGVGAALAIVAGLATGFVSLFSFIFGIATVVAVVFLARAFKSRRNITLLLSGIIISGLMASILSLIKYFARPDTQLAEITFWLMGSFASTTYLEVWIMLPIVIACTTILLCFRWRLNIVALGREEAQSKGLNYKVYRAVIIAIATLLTTTSVAFCGTIAWVGLVIPHMVRLITGKNTVKSLPLCVTFGGLFMIIVDIFCRTFTAAEIPVSAITGIFGIVVFVVILITKRRNFYEY